MADKKVTIAEVAKRAGVSKATISNYLNKRYDRMKEETKDKIQEAIDALGYIPSISARRLSAKEKSKTVGLIIPGNLAKNRGYSRCRRCFCCRCGNRPSGKSAS